MASRLTVSDIIPAAPRAIYDAWLDSRSHAAMTGAKAKVSAKVGSKFSAWDGYISGVNLELIPGKRIVQSWRSTEFSAADPDSRIAVTLKPVAGGTRVTLLHTRVPDGQSGYKAGWKEWYFEPMKAWFAGRKAARRGK